MKEKIKELLLKLSAFGTLAIAETNAVYSDIFSDAGKALDGIKGTVYNIAVKIFPLAIVICAVAMLVTRDQKKFDTEKHILIGCIIAFLIIWLVCEKFTSINEITNVFNGNAGGGA